MEAFFHDVPADVVAQAIARGEPVTRFDNLFSQPWPLDSWPKVPTRFMQARDDRFFPLEFQHRIVAERLDIPVEELPGGHLVALSQPEEVAERLCGRR
jgi:pimeloyl-ACP methyl ester carboxylesterase